MPMAVRDLKDALKRLAQPFGSLRQLARAAGLSADTASRAINGPGVPSPTTFRKIRKAAGYPRLADGRYESDWDNLYQTAVRASTQMHTPRTEREGRARTTKEPTGRGGPAPVMALGLIPRPADSFQSREESRELAALLSGDDVDTVVLSGMGGVGKTQLAAWAADDALNADGIALVLWATARSRTAILTAYAQGAAHLDPGGSGELEEDAARFLAWLRRTDRRWLIVLDDLETPQDLDHLWPPSTRTGRTIVTTRRGDAALRGQKRRRLKIDTFSATDAVAYLASKLNHDPGLLTEADELARDLGYLPLALAQAAAYMLDRGLGCADYRRRLADERRRLADLVPEEGALPDAHRDTVAATWSVSINLADGLNPVGLARPVVQLAALLDPDAAPGALFGTAPIRQHLIELLGRSLADEDIRDALYCLQRLSLAAYDEDLDVVRVHALVQRAVREDTPTRRADLLSLAAADGLVEIWPVIERDPVLAERLRANADALYKHRPGPLWNSTGGVHPLLLAAGESLGDAGLADAAYRYFQTLQAEALQRLGAEHRYTLTLRANAAYWQGQAGDVKGATVALIDLVEDMQRVLGQDDPNTLTCRVNLADLMGERGDAAGAAAALAELLTDRLRILGPDHKSTLNTRHNLAHWQGAAGDPAGAAAALDVLADDFVRIFGADHPDTLTTRLQQAYWRGTAGDPRGAFDAYVRLVEDFVHVYGAEHPETLIVRHECARFQGESGDAAGAALAFAALLDDRLRVLGPSHPRTLSTRHETAYWRGEAGAPGEAAAALAELAEEEKVVIGPDHPNTLFTRQERARFHGEAGDAAGAAKMFAELLRDKTRVFGADHPETLGVRGLLGRWTGEAGDPEGAVHILRQLYADRVRLLGADHPDTANTLRRIRRWEELSGH